MASDENKLDIPGLEILNSRSSKYERKFDPSSIPVIESLKGVDPMKFREEAWGMSSAANDPDEPYEPKKKKRITPLRRRKGYDAKRYTGAIPGLAKRMAEYLKHMRDDR